MQVRADHNMHQISPFYATIAVLSKHVQTNLSICTESCQIWEGKEQFCMHLNSAVLNACCYTAWNGWKTIFNLLRVLRNSIYHTCILKDQIKGKLWTCEHLAKSLCQITLKKLFQNFTEPLRNVSVCNITWCLWMRKGKIL